MTAPNLVVSISGLPKSGKTHLSLSFPDPLLLFSFDIGYEPVLAKFPNKAIEVKTYPIPIIDTLRPKPYAREIYHQFTEDYKKAVSEGQYKTVAIDTATALYELARYCRGEELNQSGAEIVPWQYGEIYARLTAIILQPRLLGVNLVLTHHLKETYKDDKPTGKMELDGFKRTEGLVDLVLGIREATIEVKGKKKNINITLIKNNRYDRDLNGQELTDATYQDLLAVLGVG